MSTETREQFANELINTVIRIVRPEYITMDDTLREQLVSQILDTLQQLARAKVTVPGLDFHHFEWTDQRKETVRRELLSLLFVRDGGGESVDWHMVFSILTDRVIRA